MRNVPSANNFFFFEKHLPANIFFKVLQCYFLWCEKYLSLSYFSKKKKNKFSIFLIPLLQKNNGASLSRVEPCYTDTEVTTVHIDSMSALSEFTLMT